jgi:SAM-dependent methyltransferase
MTDPRFSLITFSQDPQAILRVWKSIEKTDSLNSWEWIIGIPTGENVGSGWEPITRFVGDTPNIRLLNVPSREKIILSDCLAACSEAATGKYLAFLNDNLVPAPDLISKVLALDIHADFLYGNALDGEDNIIENEHITSASLLNPNRMPKGIVIINAERLAKMGGVNKTVEYEGTANELLCRAYIDGLSFQKIPDILSTVYAFKDEERTKAAFNELVNITAVFFYPIIRAEAKDKKLELGNVIMPWSVPHPEHKSIIWDGFDLQCNGMAIIDNSYGIVRVSDILQYIPQTEAVAFMEEMWRIIAPGGWFLSSTPSARGAGAFADPRQASYWNNMTFGLFCLEKKSPAGKLFKGLFEHTRVWEAYPSDWHKQNGVPYVHAELMKMELPTPQEMESPQAEDHKKSP